MKTSKTKKVAFTTRFNTAFDTVKKTVKNTNDFALNATEGLIEESLNITEQWQNVTKNAIDGGFKLSSGQQDLMFQTLESVKAQITHGRKKVKKLLA